MKFSDLLDAMRVDGDTRVAITTPEWAHGRTTYGGMQIAIALRAMRAVLPAPQPLRTLQATFMAPVPVGDVRVRARVMRSGKNTTHVEGRIVDGEQTLCLVVAIFGNGRPSTLEVLPPMPEVGRDRITQHRRPEGLAQFLEANFRVQWLRGGPPASGQATPQAVLAVDMIDRGTATEEHVVAMADVPPPIAMTMLQGPAPGSSMTWTLEMIEVPLPALSLDGWRLDCECTAFRDGYTSQSVMVWGPNRRLIAISRQNMVVFG